MSYVQRASGQQWTNPVTWSASIALVGVTYFAVSIVALHVLRPELNPIQRPTSEYAVGPYGWLMTSAFFSLSVASFALVHGLPHSLAQPARSRVGLALIGVWAVGLLIAMRFPIDLDRAPSTITGTIHRTNGPLTFLALTVGVVLVSWRFRYATTWRPYHCAALGLSLVMLAAFVATPVSLATQAGMAGLSQRIYLAAFVTWFLLTAWRLRAGGVEARPA